MKEAVEPPAALCCKPVARVAPSPAEPSSGDSTVKGTLSYAEDEDLHSTGEVWDAEK